ncbi:DUF4260 family protein [Sorangium sp. So ce861]|uniref:DUF4260 family protein n=1 Tax=Sorangium sp. So ce861 TaxID=3133323 RepID=UPI003F63BB7E
MASASSVGTRPFGARVKSTTPSCDSSCSIWRHSHLAPALLAVASVALGSPALLLGAAIWVGHIGFDRMLGYGLKYGTAFGDTHLARPQGYAPKAKLHLRCIRACGEPIRGRAATAGRVLR